MVSQTNLKTKIKIYHPVATSLVSSNPFQVHDSASIFEQTVGSVLEIKAVQLQNNLLSL